MTPIVELLATRGPNVSYKLGRRQCPYYKQYCTFCLENTGFKKKKEENKSKVKNRNTNEVRLILARFPARGGEYKVLLVIWWKRDGFMV